MILPTQAPRDSAQSQASQQCRHRALGVRRGKCRKQRVLAKHRELFKYAVRGKCEITRMCFRTRTRTCLRQIGTRCCASTDRRVAVRQSEAAQVRFQPPGATGRSLRRHGLLSGAAGGRHAEGRPRFMFGFWQPAGVCRRAHRRSRTFHPLAFASLSALA
jgi:hypothetical protein